MSDSAGSKMSIDLTDLSILKLSQKGMEMEMPSMSGVILKNMSKNVKYLNHSSVTWRSCDII